MPESFSRRGFLRVGAAAAGCALHSLGGPLFAQDQAAPGSPHAEKLGWHLGCQAYSFNRFTFFEAVDKTASLGLKWIEAYPGQRLCADSEEVKVGPGMSDDQKQQMLGKLSDAGVTLVNLGVIGLPNNEEGCRRVFDFAKSTGIKTIVSEPPLDAFDLIEKLAEEYGINVAIHNHPAPSTYWNYETVLEVCKGRSKRLGACADTGHWMRSGIKPIDAIKALEGRIISFHLKDLNKYGRQGAHDVPWGTGQADLQAILTEIHRQKLEAVFSIEYEHNWLNSLPEIAQSVQYFDEVAAKLSGEN